MARSYWQPLPANGYVTILLTPTDTGSDAASMGTQNIAPGGHVRKHSHVSQEEIIHVLEGKGTAMIEGERHPMTPGSVFFLTRGTRHSFVNDGDCDLRYTWTIMPGHGLHEFFAAIGRPRHPGDSAPLPFPRPGDALALALEARNGFTPQRNSEEP